MNSNSVADKLIAAARLLARKVNRLEFSAPVTHVYNPLSYAWEPHATYLLKYGATPKPVVFLGMNPGPFGMVQTGVPFGEIAAVRSWLGIAGKVGRPAAEHPKRLVTGFDCPRCEVSGQRLWGLFQERFKTADQFFKSHFVVNYCPLAFLEATGRNRTPDKLPSNERAALYAACDAHLRATIKALQPEWLVGVGDFAVRRAAEIAAQTGIKVGQILHPSPASPLANRGWGKIATEQLIKMGIWR
jgi:single-strand selective monofunctional uracil DNA glycosylase